MSQIFIMLQTAPEEIDFNALGFIPQLKVRDIPDIDPTENFTEEDLQLWNFVETVQKRMQSDSSSQTESNYQENFDGSQANFLVFLVLVISALFLLFVLSNQSVPDHSSSYFLVPFHSSSGSPWKRKTKRNERQKRRINRHYAFEFVTTKYFGRNCCFL